jgi:hypothetical protein
MIAAKAIKPSKLKQEVFRLEFLSAVHDMERQIIREFNKTTDTWQGEKPTFKALISLQNPGPTIVVGPSGSTKGAQKWEWLDKGTRVRYATMSPDWISKTTPNVVGSRAGRGRMLFVNKNIPHPGIEARNWDKIIGKQFAPRFKRRMEEAMRTATKKSGHAI